MAVPSSTFLEKLKSAGLFSDSVSAIETELSSLGSADQVAEQLVRREMLTEYQSQVLLKNEAIPLVIGDYVVTDMLGRGGMGLVLKARHVRMQRLVAVKLLLKSMTPTPELEQRFQREVQAAAQLHHPNIVAAYDAGVCGDGSHYLVMQLIEGQNLSELIKSRGPLAMPLAVNMICQAAAGLGYAHERGIIHRDVKPGNLLLDHEGVVRVLDLGLARFQTDPAGNGPAAAELTSSGSVMGTIHYMAPEQAIDARSVDQRADIYSLGCTLYYLLTGNAPFAGDSIMQRLSGKGAQTIPALKTVRPETPPQLEAIYQKMLAPNPADRPASMREVAESLNKLNLLNVSGSGMETVDQASELYGQEQERFLPDEIFEFKDASELLDRPADRGAANRSSRPGDRNSAKDVVADRNASNSGGSKQDGDGYRLQTPDRPAPSGSKFSVSVSSPQSRGGQASDAPAAEPSKPRERRAVSPDSQVSNDADTDEAQARTAQRPRAGRSENRGASRAARHRSAQRSRGPSQSREVDRRSGPRMSSAERWLRHSTAGIPNILVVFSGVSVLLLVGMILTADFGGSGPVPESASGIEIVDGSNRSASERRGTPQRSGQSGAAESSGRIVEAALWFDGKDDHAMLANLDVGAASALSMDALIQPETDNVVDRVTIVQFSNAARLFLQREPASWRLGCTLQNDAGKQIESLSEKRHRYGEEAHVAMVWTGSIVKTYVNGEDQTAWRFLNGLLVKNTGPLWIGDDLGRQTTFHGQIDDVRVLTRDLDAATFGIPAEIDPDDAALAVLYRCNADSGTELRDSSPHGRHATVTGASWTSVTRAGTGGSGKASDEVPQDDRRTIEPLTSLNSPHSDAYCWVSNNGLKIYFTREGSGGVRQGTWTSQRQNPTARFEAPTFAADVRHLVLTGDELHAVGLRGFGSAPALCQASRSFRQVPFSDFQNINAFTGSQGVKSPWLTSDGLTIVFQRLDADGSYPGKTELGIKTAFALAERNSVRNGWFQPAPLRLADSPLLTGSLTWPMLTDDRLTLFFCNGGGRTSEVLVATRQSRNAGFSNVQRVLINGQPLIARAPRYIAQTRELFISRLVAGSQTDWDLAVIRNFDLQAYR